MDRFKDQLSSLFDSLSGGQRFAILAVATFTLAAVGFVRWQASSDFKPLYTSLSPQDGGAVVEQLKQSAIEYRLSDDGSTILVPSGVVAEARLQMAGAGLPKTGRIGFELFDQTNLGLTEFAEHVNYRRALEGELERSIVSLGAVEQSRVHLTFAKESVFRDTQQPAKASVLVKLRPGRRLQPRNVVAVGHLVAAAVEDLDAHAVSILDMEGNLLSRPRTDNIDGTEVSDAFVRYRQTLEGSYVKKIEAALTPLLGAGRFQAGVSVECSYTSGEQTEEILDPEQSVIVSQQRTEEGAAPGAGASGTPGTASALPRPRGDIIAAGAGSARMTESTQYQTARTVRHTRIPGGLLEKVSTAILVDHTVRWEGEGDERTRIVEPRTPEELASIREIVSAVIGFDAQRGDQLNVESLPFALTQNPPELGPISPSDGEQAPRDLLQRLQQDPVLMGVAGGAVLVLLLAVFFIVKMLKKKKGQPAQAAGAPATLPAAPQNPVQQGGAVMLPDQVGAYQSQSSQRALIERAQQAVSADAEMGAGVVHEWLLQSGGEQQ